MKNITCIYLFLALFILLGCEDDYADHQVKAVAVSFKVKEVNAEEGGSPILLHIMFSKPAPNNGRITIESNIDLAGILTSNQIVSSRKIESNASKDDGEVTILLNPVDDAQANGNKRIVLKFRSASDGFVLPMNDSLVLTVTDNDISQQQRVINFTGSKQVLSESNSVPVTFRLLLDQPLPADGAVSLIAKSATPGFESHLRSVPAFNGRKITLLATAGAQELTFQVHANDNQIVQGDIEVTFEIEETSANIRKGPLASQTLVLKDDELSGKLKAYEVTDGHDIHKQNFEYDAMGRISKIRWQRYTPYLTEGTHDYVYDDESRLIRIDKDAQRSVIFSYQEGKVVKSEVNVEGEVKEYVSLSYDVNGNIAGVQHFVREDDGTYIHTLTHVYLYFPDGNIHKAVTYAVDPTSQELTWISTHTYDQYTSTPIPVSMLEIIPQVKSQTTSPKTYKHQTLAHDLLYNLSYEINSEGLVEKRIARSGSSYQTTVYLYY